jgi:hypothetical protein
MPEPTKDAPFEFEGVKVWRDEGGAVKFRRVEWDDRGVDLQVADYLIPVIHAFIEAERAAHPVDDGVFRYGSHIVEERPNGELAVADTTLRYIIHNRAQAQAIIDRQTARGEGFADMAIVAIAGAAIKHYDAQAPASEPAWKSWKPGDVGQVRIDGGEWETVLVGGVDSTVPTVMMRANHGDLRPWHDTSCARRLDDSRNATVTPDRA